MSYVFFCIFRNLPLFYFAADDSPFTFQFHLLSKLIPSFSFHFFRCTSQKVIKKRVFYIYFRPFIFFRFSVLVCIYISCKRKHDFSFLQGLLKLLLCMCFLFREGRPFPFHSPLFFIKWHWKVKSAHLSLFV